MSIRTGAPAALALALGFQEPTKGTAAPVTPATPATDVEPTRNFLRPALVLSLVTVIFSLRTQYKKFGHQIGFFCLLELQKTDTQ